MKKILFFFFIALLALNVSCDDKETTSEIVGTWEFAGVTSQVSTSSTIATAAIKDMLESMYEGFSGTLTFRKDGTGNDGFDDFTYTYSGQTLSIHWEGDDVPESINFVVKGNACAMTIDMTDFKEEAEFMDSLNALVGTTVTINSIKVIFAGVRQ